MPEPDPDIPSDVFGLTSKLLPRSEAWPLLSDVETTLIRA